MRLFVAIPLDGAIKTALCDAQNRLQGVGADVKWVEADALHLTVHFLGDIGEPLLLDIEAVCENLAQSTKAFRFVVRGLSVFPRRGPLIKTIWAAVTEGADEWKTLAQTAEANLVPLGAAKANDLVPHLTLGRVKGEQKMDELKAAIVSESATDFGMQTAREIVLVQSFLNPGGALHQTVRRWDLAE